MKNTIILFSTLLTGLCMAEIEDALRAAEKGDVKALAQQKAYINSSDDQGITPLMLAAQHGQVKAVEYLLSNGVAIDTINDPSEVTALMLASEEGHLEAVKLLLHKGANPNIVSWYDLTALMLASYNGHHDVASTLIEAGAEVNTQVPRHLAKEGNAHSALGLACRNNQIDTVRLLLQQNADMFQKPEDSDTLSPYEQTVADTEKAELLKLLKTHLQPKLWDKDYLISQIDIAQDDYLRDASMLKDVRVKTLHTGAFSAPNAQELLVVFSIDNVPHVAGLGRVILVLFDTKTGKPMAQKSIMGDRVNIELLRTAQNTTLILGLSTMINQGYYSYGYAGLQLTGKELKSLPILDKKLQEKLMDGAMLHYRHGYLDVFDVRYDEERNRTLTPRAQLVWDKENLCFKTLSSDSPPPLRGYEMLTVIPPKNALSEGERNFIHAFPNIHSNEAIRQTYELIDKNAHETLIQRFTYFPLDESGQSPPYKVEIFEIRKCE